MERVTPKHVPCSLVPAYYYLLRLDRQRVGRNKGRVPCSKWLSPGYARSSGKTGAWTLPAPIAGTAIMECIDIVEREMFACPGLIRYGDDSKIRDFHLVPQLRGLGTM